MAQYTEDDIAAAGKFADANNTIRLLRKMYEKSPHLASWLDVKVRDATFDDYYIPSTLAHCSKVVEINFTEKLCTLLSCNPMKERDNCKTNEKASYYYVGDDGYDVQCQPSCFHTAAKISYNENGERAADVPQLNWNPISKECKIVNSSVVSWLEKTFYRSDTKFEIRVNDMPTGFSRIPSTNEYGSGFTYKTNKAYCNYYDRTLQADGSCDMTIAEKILDAIIGQTLINSLKSGIRMLTNNNIPFDLPKNLPELPSELPTELTLEGWRNNINKDFVLPDIIDTKPKIAKASAFAAKFSTHIKNDEVYHNYDHEVLNNNDEDRFDMHNYRRQAELSTEDMSNFMRTCIGLEVDKSPDRIFGLDENGEILQPLGSSPTPRAATIPGNEGKPETDEKKKHWTEQMKDFFIALLKMFTESETYVNIGIDLLSQLALSKIKSLSVKVIEKMTIFLSKGLYDVTGSIGVKVLMGGIKGVATKVITGMALRIGAKLAILMAKILGATASVIGWLLVGTMILDLLFSFWDPFGYNNMFPPQIPNDIMNSGELSLRQALAVPSAVYKFENLAAIILSEDEMLELQLESLIDRLIYLDALVVNSEGSRIDKGREINVNTGSTYDMEAARNAGMAERVKFDPAEFHRYNDRFMVRVKLNKYLNYISAASVLTSAVFGILQLPILAFIAIIIALIVLALSRLELQDDILVDLMAKYRNKTSMYDQKGYDYE